MKIVVVFVFFLPAHKYIIYIYVFFGISKIKQLDFLEDDSMLKIRLP